MVEVNRMTTPANMRWILEDRHTGARNHAIDWRFSEHLAMAVRYALR
jgi:hypothetical protein